MKKIIAIVLLVTICLSCVSAFADTNEKMRGIWKWENKYGEHFVVIGVKNIICFSGIDGWMDSYCSGTDKLEYLTTINGVECYEEYEWNGTYSKNAANKYDILYKYNPENDSLIYVDSNKNEYICERMYSF